MAKANRTEYAKKLDKIVERHAKLSYYYDEMVGAITVPCKEANNTLLYSMVSFITEVHNELGETWKITLYEDNLDGLVYVACIDDEY